MPPTEPIYGAVPIGPAGQALAVRGEAGLMHRLANRMDRFFFRPSGAFDLGFCRVLFFLGILLLNRPRELASWVNQPHTFWRAIWLFRVLHLPLLSALHMQILVGVWYAFLALSCVGFLTRISTWGALAIGAYVLGLQDNFGKVGHGDPVLIFTMLILAMSRCGDALSIDAWIRSRKTQKRFARSGEYTWPIRMAWVLLCIVFAAAGATKLICSGLGWITSDNLQILLLQHHYALKNPWTSVGFKIAQHPLLCHLMAAGSVAVELSFPLALFSRRLRRVILPAGFLMQIGIGLTMGVYFISFLMCYLFWVPWHRLWRFWRRVWLSHRPAIGNN